MASGSASARRSPSTASTSSPTADTWSRSWARTAPARRRSSARWRRSCVPTRDRCASPGTTCARTPGAVRRAIGLAGQFAAIEPAMTGRENLEMVGRLFGHGRRSARSSAAAVLEQLGLADAGDRLARTYSGGMRRRLDLGASLVGAPRLLLLDEPTTGLDPRSRIELWDAIRTLVEGGTDVLLTTQHLDEADQLASHVVIVDHGRAVAAGSPTELKRRIGGDVVELHVRDGADLAHAAELLARIDHRAPRIDVPTRRVSVRVDAGSDGLMTALRSVEGARIEIEDIALRQPNLDEVFLAITAQPTEPHEPIAADAA